MRPATHPFSRRTRTRLHAATACLSLLLWLFLTTAEGYTPLHAWIHGGAIPDNDDCAVAMATHGKVDLSVPVAPVTTPVTGIEVTPRAEIFFHHPTIAFLPDGRGPPAVLSSLA